MSPFLFDVVSEVVPDAPLRAPTAPVSVAVAEVLSLDPRLLADLPAPSTLVCARVGSDPVSYVVVTTSAVVYQAMTSAGQVPVFTGSELVAMTVAVERDRGSPDALTQWCDRKLERGPSWRLSIEYALGPVFDRVDARGWSMFRVLGMLGLDLRHVDVGDEGTYLVAVITSVRRR